jgi:alkanesulfonate monooxygenase SsuD/methylene tetrahydromethanopterin reductase-like flavin-dependent oxidoreductase (luciferase family)
MIGPMEATAHPRHLGFGLVARGQAGSAALAGLGEQLAELGYDELWANDNAARSGLATLAAATAGGHPRLELGLGVAPLSDKTPRQLADEVAALDLPRDRLILGIGTGSSSSLELVRHGVEELRERLPDVRICIAALGPRMCRLAGEIADAVLLNWAYPERLAWASERVAAGARDAGRPKPRVASYVRVALGADAHDRLLGEANRYRGRPRPYTRLFAAQAADETHVPGIAAVDSAAVPALLAPYRDVLDSCVVRALPASDSVEALIEIARAAARSA